MSYKFNPFLGTLDIAGNMAIGGSILNGTAGSVLFIDPTGKLGQDNANFRYDPSVPVLYVPYLNVNNDIRSNIDGVSNLGTASNRFYNARISNSIGIGSSLDTDAAIKSDRSLIGGLAGPTAVITVLQAGSGDSAYFSGDSVQYRIYSLRNVNGQSIVSTSYIQSSVVSINVNGDSVLVDWNAVPLAIGSIHFLRNYGQEHTQ